jgi:hypothetical protein
MTRHYAKYLNIPIQICSICGEEITIERFRSGLKKFHANDGTYHDCEISVESLPPMNDREYFEQKYNAQPAKRRERKNGTKVVG